MRKTFGAVSIRRHLLASGLILLTGGGAFAAFAVGTELSGAVIASGILVVDSFVKKVQHQTGGVVKNIAVKDGDVVKEGDILLTFDETIARANLSIIDDELDELYAAKARAEAERSGYSTISFPQALMDHSSEPRVATLIAGTKKQFETGIAARAGQRAQLQERLAQLHTQIEGVTAQMKAKKKEIELVAIELSSSNQLWEKRLIQLTQYVSLQREDVKVQGEYGQLSSTGGELGGKIAETQLQIIQIDEDLRKEDEKEIAQNRTRTSELLERKIAAQDQLTRLVVRAPQNGTVHELSIHTVGGIVAPQGDPIMLIVPGADVLKVEAKVQVQDIDQVHVGEEVQIRLSGLNQRTTPELVGKVASVSADSITDSKTQASYFKVRIELETGEAAKFEDTKLVPGMPAEVFIVTSAPRSVLSYLTKPLRDQAVRAFR